MGAALLLLLASCAPPPVESPRPAPGAWVGRAAWGARPPAAPMQPHEVRSITIHHTATRQQPDRPLAEKMRALQRFSQAEAPLGGGRTKAAWPDIPYHLYIDHAGRVAEGRETEYAGDTNTAYDPAGHLLIVLEGNFEEEEPTPAQMETLRGLVAELADRYGVPAERVEGHRDHADTLCPGRKLYEELPGLREWLRARPRR